MDEDRLMFFMRNTGLIPLHGKRRVQQRTIYESGEGSMLRPSGRFYMDYAGYGGTGEEVPKTLIDRLEKEGKLVRAFPDHPAVNGWKLADAE